MRYTVINILSLVYLSVNAWFSFGQQLSSHPLSSYGIGDHQLNDHGIYTALGNIFTPFSDSSQLNYLNPASYAALSKGNTLYSIGVSQRISIYTQAGQKDIRPNGNLTHIALGFKLKKHFGMAFGLKPLAAKGFYLSEKVFTGLDSIRNTYQGSGYVNQVFLGGTYAPIVSKRTYLGLGFNANYNFGSVTNQRISQLIQGTTAAGGVMEDIIRIYDLSVDFGLSAYQKIGLKSDLRVGATFRPKQALNSVFEHAFYSATNINTPSNYDTLYATSTNGFTYQGQVLTLGLAYRIALNPYKVKTKTLHPELTIATQYSNNQAYTYSTDTSFLAPAQAKRYSLGVEFKPERFLYENIATLGFFDKFTYRVGAYYGTLPYADANNQSFKEQAITFGLGIPVLAQQSFSSINFSCTLGQRGTFVTNSLQENFVSFQLSAILSPASFERWFRKRKMD
jgi:hypothetical protein